MDVSYNLLRTMKNLYQISYLVLLLLLKGAETDRLFKNHHSNITSPVNFEEASTLCRHQGFHLPVFASAEHYVEAIETIQATRLHSFWLGIEKKTFKAWTWVDGTEYNYQYLEFAGSHDCGLLDYTAQHLRKQDCSSLSLGYICQRSNFSSCVSLKVGYRQLQVDNSCYRVFTEKVNWYEARWRCQQQGMDLAVLRGKAQEEQLSARVRENFDVFNMWQFWVGFRKAEWIPIAENVTLKSAPVFWDWNEPRHKGDCAIARRTGESFYWKTTHCSSRHRYVCQSSKLVLATDGTSAKLQSAAGRQAITAGSVLVMMINMIFAVLYRRGYLF